MKFFELLRRIDTRTKSLICQCAAELKAATPLQRICITLYYVIWVCRRAGGDFVSFVKGKIPRVLADSVGQRGMREGAVLYFSQSQSPKGLKTPKGVEYIVDESRYYVAMSQVSGLCQVGLWAKFQMLKTLRLAHCSYFFLKILLTISRKKNKLLATDVRCQY
jgi:hypothetical protein